MRVFDFVCGCYIYVSVSLSMFCDSVRICMRFHSSSVQGFFAFFVK